MQQSGVPATDIRTWPLPTGSSTLVCGLPRQGARPMSTYFCSFALDPSSPEFTPYDRLHARKLTLVPYLPPRLSESFCHPIATYFSS